MVEYMRRRNDKRDRIPTTNMGEEDIMAKAGENESDGVYWEVGKERNRSFLLL
jgi:hypothetical protein